jgi:hypothetical protein
MHYKFKWKSGNMNYRAILTGFSNRLQLLEACSSRLVALFNLANKSTSALCCTVHADSLTQRAHQCSLNLLEKKAWKRRRRSRSSGAGASAGTCGVPRDNGEL